MQTKITHRFIRLLSVLMALDMIENMISPALWIFGEMTAFTSTVGKTPVAFSGASRRSTTFARRCV